MKLRTRFSVRTLAIFVTLVCAYFGGWEVTKKYATDYPISGATAPFVIWRVTEIKLGVTWVEYYIWVFGAKLKLPIKSEWKDSPYPQLLHPIPKDYTPPPAPFLIADSTLPFEPKEK